MGRLQLIEQKISALNSAHFQELCDDYLLNKKYLKINSYNKSGSQVGKQKTIKGTPDSLYYEKDGELFLVEITTQSERLGIKIISDIDKCLELQNNYFSKEKKLNIIFLFNSKLNSNDFIKVNEYSKDKNINLQLFNIDILAHDICNEYHYISKDKLGIPLDTGQILKINDFIEEYNNKAGNLSTPLDNTFLHRKKELEEIENILKNVDLLIISGFPGVGKTKIAIEAINRFKLIYKDYEAFVIADKSVGIFEDLKLNLKQDKNYILFIDDANRQLNNFKQILGVFKEKRKGIIKLILTVRNYAYDEVYNECSEFRTEKFELIKFTDIEITDLISGEPFKIINRKYQDKILELSDGNARLAVMCSRLAIEKNYDFLFGDISNLYDSYFNTFLKSKSIFKNESLMKTLGINSFFYTIELKDPKQIDEICLNFKIERNIFLQTIEGLEKMELLEINYEISKVSEQILSTYFFYKVFIKDKLLSFEVLLINYYDKYKKRFKDLIYSNINSFSYKIVIKYFESDLSNYYENIKEDKNKVSEFLDLFWFYKIYLTLEYCLNKIEQIQVSPELKDFYYNNEYKENKINDDEIITLLINILNSYFKEFDQALELCFEYIKKVPLVFQLFIKKIRDNFVFSDDFYNFSYKKEVALFDFLNKKFNNHEDHIVETYFELAETYLKFEFLTVKSGRKHSINFGKVYLQNYEITKNFRRQIWETLINNYERYPDKIFNIFKNYNTTGIDKAKDIFLFDLNYIFKFIEQMLDKNNMMYINYVQNLFFNLKEEYFDDYNLKKLKHIKSIFINEEYKNFKVLDEYYYGTDKLDENCKKEKIKQAFVFSDESNFYILHNAIKNYQLYKKDLHLNIYIFDYIIEVNFKNNEKIGYALIESLLSKFDLNIYLLSKSLMLIINSDNYYLKFWNFINTLDKDKKNQIKLYYFELIPIDFINKKFTNELLKSIKSINFRYRFNLSTFEKFEKFEKDILKKIIEIINEKNKQLDLKISFFNNFLNFKIKELKSNIDLLIDAYIYEYKIYKYFDLKKIFFIEIVKLKPDFLIKFIKMFIFDKDYNYNDPGNNFSFIWDLDHVIQIEEIIELLISENIYLFIQVDKLSIFFKNLNETQKQKAKDFISLFIGKNNLDSYKMNIIFDVIREYFNEDFERFLLLYLNFNTNIETFEKINWMGNKVKVYSGEVNFGELDKMEWEKIKKIIEKENNTKYIKILNFIENKIKYSLIRSKDEKISKYKNPYY